MEAIRFTAEWAMDSSGLIACSESYDSSWAPQMEAWYINIMLCWCNPAVLLHSWYAASEDASKTLDKWESDLESHVIATGNNPCREDQLLRSHFVYPAHTVWSLLEPAQLLRVIHNIWELNWSNAEKYTAKSMYSWSSTIDGVALFSLAPESTVGMIKAVVAEKLPSLLSRADVSEWLPTPDWRFLDDRCFLGFKQQC